MLSDQPVTTSSLVARSDPDLVRMHAEGDKEALGVLCQRHHDRLMAAAARIAGQDADDADQDGWLKAYLKADRFRGDSAVTTWLYRIVVNAALDIIRRSPRVAEAVDEPWTDPEITHAESRIDLRRQWNRISRDHQATLLLVDMMDYPVAEAAKLLGVSEGTIKSR